MFWLRCGNWLRDHRSPWRWLKSPDLEFYLYFMFLHFYYKWAFIYISFIFTMIKCSFRGCSAISRSKGSVDQLATFKGCCRLNQPCVSNQCAPWPRRLSASTWPVTPGSHHPHWNEGDHVNRRTSKLIRSLYHSVTLEHFKGRCPPHQYVSQCCGERCPLSP